MARTRKRAQTTANDGKNGQWRHETAMEVSPNDGLAVVWAVNKLFFFSFFLRYRLMYNVIFRFTLRSNNSKDKKKNPNDGLAVVWATYEVRIEKWVGATIR